MTDIKETESKKKKKFLFIFLIFFAVAFVLFALHFIMTEIFPFFEDLPAECLSEEHGVWDYEQNICRHDCLTWNKEQGCVPFESMFYRTKSK